MKIDLHKTDKSSRRGEMYSFRLFRDAVMHPDGVWLRHFLVAYTAILSVHGFSKAERALGAYGVVRMEVWLKAFIGGVEMSVTRRPRLDWRGSELGVLTAIIEDARVLDELMPIVRPVMLKYHWCVERGRRPSVLEVDRDAEYPDAPPDVRALVTKDRLCVQLPILAEALLKTYEQWLAS